MNTTKPKDSPEKSIVAAVVFYGICGLLFPILVAGYVLWIGKLFSGRKSGVSGTAQGPLSARWLQHQLGVRQDAAAHRLLMSLPGVSPLAVKMVFGPILFANRLSGYVPPTFRYPFEGKVTLQNQASARQTFYDSTVEQYLSEITQLVILGAGFDTRSLRLPSGAKVRAFEVDSANTLAIKREAMHKAGIDTSQVALLDADFEKQDWLHRLQSAGFDTTQPTLFLWEGVTPYLHKSAVEDTLRKIAGCGKGSRVAFDYFSSEILESPALHLKLLRASLNAGNEPLKFGIDSTPPFHDRVAELLDLCGLRLEKQFTLGQEGPEERALGGFAIAAVA